MKFKKQCSNDNKLQCIPRRGIFNLTPLLTAIPKQNSSSLDIKNQIDVALKCVPPVIHLISNENYEGANASRSNSASGSSDSSDTDLGEVLNSIENRLGLAAIENGQQQEGLNLLR